MNKQQAQKVSARLRRDGDIDAAEEIDALLEYIDGLENLGRKCAKTADDTIKLLQQELRGLRTYQ